MLYIALPTFTSKRLHHTTDWSRFGKIMADSKLPKTAWDTKDTRLLVASTIIGQFQQAINAAIPWSKPGPKTKPRWTPEITSLKKKLAVGKRWRRKNGTYEETKKAAKEATRRWKRAIRDAQWIFWEDKLRSENRAPVQKTLQVVDNR